MLYMLTLPLLLTAAAPAPTPFPACPETSQAQLQVPTTMLFDPQSVAHFRKGNPDGYAYFTVTFTSGKVGASIPDSAYIDKAMRETIGDTAQAFVFVANGSPCTPAQDQSILVKFYADGEMQIGPNKHAATASPSPR